MSSKAFIISALATGAFAAFGKEQIPVSFTQALGNRGQPGQAATLAGGIPGVLLAGANACAKLEHADLIVQTLGDFEDVIAAARELVGAEKNFNPFAVSIPSICGNAGLPATEALRGVMPQIDTAVTGAAAFNVIAAASKTTPVTAAGLSVAEVMTANGFSNFTIQNSDGSAGAGGAGVGGAGAGGAGAGGAGAGGVGQGGAGQQQQGCNGGQAGGNQGGNAGQGNQGGNNNAGGKVDFGLCVPTMDFVGGRANRAATEFTFLPTDALVAKGQQEALNPNIITNRICDQLTNVCQANQAAKDLCLDAKAQVQAAGTRDQTTADLFNGLLGF